MSKTNNRPITQTPSTSIPPAHSLDPDDLPVAVSEVVGDGPDAHREIHRGPLALVAWFATGAENALVRHEELGRWLGYDRPRKVRELIERIWPENRRPIQRPGVGRRNVRGGGVQEYIVNEYWLTQAQALRVAMRAETVNADEVQEFIAKVFLAVARGLARHARPANDGVILELTQRLDALAEAHLADRSSLSDTILKLETRIQEMESDAAVGVIGEEAARSIRARLATAAKRASFGDKKAERARRQSYTNVLRNALEHVGQNSAWSLLARGKLKDAERILHAIEKAAETERDAHIKGLQLDLRIQTSGATGTVIPLRSGRRGA